MSAPRSTRPKLPRTIETIAAGEELSSSERWLLVVIVSHAGSFARWSWPGYVLLAKLTGFEPRSVARLVLSCETKGWLKVQRQLPGHPQTSNAYKVTPTAEALVIVEAQIRARAASARGEKRASKPERISR